MIGFGNRVLCLVVLFLLQSAGWMGMAQGEPRILVGIKEHLYYYGLNGKNHVTYSDRKSQCEGQGGHVLSGHTEALRTEVVKKIEGDTLLHDEMYFFIGADAEYSVNDEPDPAKRCDYSVPSLNCIYKWNLGLWANALGDGAGVGFFKGNDEEVIGAEAINGYDVTVFTEEKVRAKPFIIRGVVQANAFVIYLSNEDDYTEISSPGAMVVCEVQDGTINGVSVTTTTEAPTTTTEAPTTTTEAPTTTNRSKARTTTNKSQYAVSGVSGTSEKSDDHSGWSSGKTAVVVILPILLVILAIVLCLYCCGCICRRKADGCRVTEDSKATIHTDRKGIVLQRNTENPDVDTAAGNGMNPFLGEDGQDRREIVRNTWIENPQHANPLVHECNPMSCDSGAAAEQQTRRMSCTRSTHSSSWGSMSDSEVVVHLPEYIVDGPDDARFWGN